VFSGTWPYPPSAVEQAVFIILAFPVVNSRHHPRRRRDYNPAPEDPLTIHRFQLRGEFIPLNDLLKLLGLAPSGGADNSF